jgi:hypothetical protein
LYKDAASPDDDEVSADNFLIANANVSEVVEALEERIESKDDTPDMAASIK